MKLKIAFILDHGLMHYRLPFFTKLSLKGYDITIFHSGKIVVNHNINFRQIYTPEKSILKVLNYKTIENLDNYDIVVCMQNIRLINLWWLTFNPYRKNKIIQWGIGSSSAKGLGSQSKTIKIIRNLLVSKADAVVYYSNYPLLNTNIRHINKAFVALNTIDNPISTDLSGSKKDSFLFIGSLNKRKGLMSILSAFNDYLKNHNPENIKNLIIIGEGEEGISVKKFVKDNNLEGNIYLIGKLDNFESKLPYFEKSIASISMRQAGLSVLESFSFGLPFVTLKNAISGGEHLNITNEENGFLLDSEDDLQNLLKWFDLNEENARILGKNAFDFYTESANMNNMVEVFDCAIRSTQ